jgi:hypothetical protein
MKIVFEYNWNVEHEASGTETIPFEYSSIEDFQFMVLEKIKEHKEKCIKEYGNIDGSQWYRNGNIKILNQEFNVGSLEDSIEFCVYELDDWFEKNWVKY